MTALDRYRAATQAWREATAATERATKQRAYALADMAASMPVDEVARRAGLSVKRAEQLIAKAHQEDV